MEEQTLKIYLSDKENGQIAFNLKFELDSRTNENEVVVLFSDVINEEKSHVKLDRTSSRNVRFNNKDLNMCWSNLQNKIIDGINCPLYEISITELSPLGTSKGEM